MQKFVVKKSKSAPLAASSSQPAQLKPTLCGAEKTVPPNATTATALNSTESSTIVCKSDVTANKPVIKSVAATASSTSSSSASVMPISQTTSVPAPSTTVSHVKMSGYLKKKRNKMGGWRKLWFVLQNQLLLSYSSKEDYEKKLAPFKDVLNLVPGTVVRPTKGPRFTIETSTNLIYTFRCDNNKECSEWITALVESLGLQSADHKHASAKLHYSMENLTKARPTASSSTSSSTASPASSFMSSRSCDSIYRSQKAKINPNLPVAQNTARILERAQNKQTTKNSAAAKKEVMTHQVQNFRLHPTEAHGNQSFEVHQINRMFSTSAIQSNTTNEQISSSANGHFGNSPRKTARNEHSKRKHHHHHHHHHRIRESLHEMPNDNHNCVIDVKADNCNNCHDKNRNRHSITTMESEPTHRFDNGNCTLLEQMQRISLENDKNFNLHASCVRKTSSIASPSLSCSSSLSSGSSGVSNASTASASKFQLLTAPKDLHGQDIMNGVRPTLNLNHLIHNKNGEPIYAVVNLKDKYENRAKKKSLDEQLVTECIHRRERPNSFHVVSGDYEEVLQLAADCVDGCEDEENIYEPINIPELTTRGPLWRYFSKINIDTLVDIARWKKEQQQQHGKDDTTTTFGDLRKRFGQHRKSIKNRMKKLYNRNGSCEVDHDKMHTNGNGNGIEINHMNGHHDTSGTSSSDSTDKVNRCASKSEGLSAYFNKRDRHLFSSMLKKSRTSLTFDDASRKKIINLAAIGGRNAVKNKPTPNLNKNGCHSKFYD